MINSNIRIGFIGFGNMGQAICDGLLRKEAVDRSKIHVCGGNWDKLLMNADSRGLNPCRTSYEVIDNSDLIVVAVKPGIVREVLAPSLNILADKAIISIAAGLDFDYYETFLGEGIHHLSTIPNIPVSVCEGVFVCENRHSLTDDQLLAFKRIFSSIARLEFVDTDLLSIGGTISGCGPAFAAVFMEAMGDAGVKYGLSRETAYALAAQMMVGTGKLYTETEIHPALIKDGVSSPGGTTIAGLSKLEECGLRSALINAVDVIMEKEEK